MSTDTERELLLAALKTLPPVEQQTVRRTFALVLGPEDSQRLHRMAAKHGNQSQAVREGLRLLEAQAVATTEPEDERAAVATLCAAWGFTSGAEARRVALLHLARATADGLRRIDT